MTSDYWQLTKAKVVDRGQHILETGQWSDCSFVVGRKPRQETFKGHKLVLAMSSSVFEAMLTDNCVEKDDLILITSVQPEAFKIMLEYIYTSKVELTSFDLAHDVYYCADVYKLPYLKQECVNYLMCMLSPQNVCMMYERLLIQNQPIQDVLEKCLQIIRTKTYEVLKKSVWEEIKLSTLNTVLDQNILHINSEVELFLAVERWTMAECRRQNLDPANGKVLRSLIGNALFKIRFLRLTYEEFVKYIKGSPLLTETEAYDILMNIMRKEAMRVDNRSIISNQPYRRKRFMSKGFFIYRN